MTTEIFFSSNKVGTITSEQVQLALDRFHLGALHNFERTAKGAGQQTLFVSSSSGEYVLKGNPLYSGQLHEEQYVAGQLQKRTTLPVPSPYVIDESEDIFGWSYAWMPRLPGKHANDPELLTQLNVQDQDQIAQLLAASLCEMHTWKTDRYGEYDPASLSIRPFEASYKDWLYQRIRYWLEDAKKYSIITEHDIEWVETILGEAEEAFDGLHSPTYVMGDFKAENLLVLNDNGGWRLSGLFDFTSGYFGDGVADLPKVVAMYMENGKQRLAERFISAYYNALEVKDAFEERFRVHMLHQRVLDWGCAKAIRKVTWDPQLSFSQWAQPYVYSAMQRR